LGAGEEGLGVGLVLVGLGLGLVGLGVGLLVPGGGLVAWLTVGCGVGDDVPVLVLDGLAVGLGVWGVVGATLVGPEGLALAVTLAEDDVDKWPVGVALADEDVRPLGVALAEALREVLGDPAGITAESTRIAAFGRLEQVPFTMGGGRPGRTAAPNTLELEARSMKPVSALSVTSLTSRAFTGMASSLTSSPVRNCPTWSSQYACHN
jgi:hypothetical protein